MSRALTAEGLTEAIGEVRARYEAEGIGLDGLTSGFQTRFTEDVLSLWVGEDWRDLEGRDGRGWRMFRTLPEPENALSPGAENHHVWIAFDGRHYDAENPEGVDQVLEMAFFRRVTGRDDDPSP